LNGHPERSAAEPRDLASGVAFLNFYKIQQQFVRYVQHVLSREHHYYVYIVASASRVLYTGITSKISGRVAQHRNKYFEGFSADHNCYRLVYYERFMDVRNAIAREKQIKRWRREKKVLLIEEINRDWKDLAADFFPDPPVVRYDAKPKTRGKVPRLRG
jgi:putative endonuclease